MDARSTSFFRSKALVRTVMTILLGVGSGAARAQGVMYVSNGSNNSVTAHTRTANGNIAPLRTIAGDATGLNGPLGLAVDTVNGELFVVNNTSTSVTVYALTDNGNVAPLRTLAGAATGLSFPTVLAVDTVHNELVVTDPGNNTITVYARTATATPLRCGPSQGCLVQRTRNWTL